MSNEEKKTTATCELDGMKVTLGRSEVDNVLTVKLEVHTDLEMDEDGVTPRARIYLNDDLLYENPEFDLDAFEAKYGALPESNEDED